MSPSSLLPFLWHAKHRHLRPTWDLVFLLRFTTLFSTALPSDSGSIVHLLPCILTVPAPNLSSRPMDSQLGSSAKWDPPPKSPLDTIPEGSKAVDGPAPANQREISNYQLLRTGCWRHMKHFMDSYRLKIWEDVDMQEAKRILNSFREHTIKDLREREADHDGVRPDERAQAHGGECYDGGNDDDQRRTIP